MATKPKTQSTAVAVIDYSDEVATIGKRLQASSADRIRTSNAKVFIFPDKSEVEEFDALIIDFIAFNRFYEGVYDEDNIVPPDCFAIGPEPSTMVPSASSPNKQCETCAGCWANQFKSAANKKGKACSNTRLIAVIPVPTGGFAVNDDMSDLPMYTLSASPTAITSFDGHVSKVVANFKKPIRTVITRVSFAQDSKWPSVRFSVVGPAGRELEAYAQSRLQEARDRLTTEPDVSTLKVANDEKIKPVAKKAAGGRR